MPRKPHVEPDHTADPRKVGRGEQLPEEQHQDVIPDDGAPDRTPPSEEARSRLNTGAHRRRAYRG